MIAAWGDDGADTTEPLTVDPTLVKVTDSDDWAEGRETQDVMPYDYIDILGESHIKYFNDASVPYPYVTIATTLAQPETCAVAIQGQTTETQNAVDCASRLTYEVHASGSGSDFHICSYDLALDPPKDDKPKVYKVHVDDTHEYIVVEWEFPDGQCVPSGEPLTLLTDFTIPQDTSGDVTYDNIVFSGSGTPSTDPVTTGGCKARVKVRETNSVKQTAYPSGAHDLEVLMWQKEDNIEVNGWEAQFGAPFHTDNSLTSSNRADQPAPAHSRTQNGGENTNCPHTDIADNGMHGVFAEVHFDQSTAPNASVEENDSVDVTSTLWLTCHNTQRTQFTWSRRDRSMAKAAPAHGWQIHWPIEDDQTPGQYIHILRLFNDDSEPFDIRNLQYVVSPTYYDDLSTVDFSAAASVPDFSLTIQGASRIVPIVTQGERNGEHIYFRFDVFWNGQEVLQKIADHPITCFPDGATCGLDTPLGPGPAPAPYDFLKNRYISLTPGSAGGGTFDIRVELVGTLVNGVTAVGALWWANPPDPDCISKVGSARPADPPDWSGCPVVHLTGCPIIPTSTYDVVAIVGGTESQPLFVAETQARPQGNKWWGDCVGTFDPVDNAWTAPNGFVAIDDAFAAIKTFQDPNAVGPGCSNPPCNATHVSVTDIEPAGFAQQPYGTPNQSVNINDVFAIILAFRGNEYPGSQLEMCPDP